jgi:ribosomal protein S18 acetylase RimI-like enzyme
MLRVLWAQTKSVYNPQAMRLRTMTSEDIPGGIRLKDIAGWNQTREDWQRFLKASPEGCFVAEVEGKICGTATTISYENRFAWIGMVLVDPEHRSRGIGTQLLERAIRHLDELQVPTLKLDATPQGKPIYEKLGFTSEFELERWALRRTALDENKITGPDSCGPISAEVLESIWRVDREVFGADRSFLLKDLHGSEPDFTLANLRDGPIEDYAFGRRGSFADHLGPWNAKSSGSARRMLETFLTRSKREVLVADCLKANPFASNLLQSLGFTYSRPLTRMYRGPNEHPGRTDALCAILGPEFG